MRPHASVAPVARSPHKPGRPMAVGRPSTTMLTRWKRPSRPNTAAERPMRKKTGKSPSSARKMPNCGTGWTRPSTLLRPSNRCSPPRAWAWAQPQPSPRLVGLPPRPWPVPVARRFYRVSGRGKGRLVRSSSDWMRSAGCWCWSAVSTRSSSTADRSWWGSIPKAWCGSWGPKWPITKVRLGSENCGPGPGCVL